MLKPRLAHYLLLCSICRAEGTRVPCHQTQGHAPAAGGAAETGGGSGPGDACLPGGPRGRLGSFPSPIRLRSERSPSAFWWKIQQLSRYEAMVASVGTSSPDACHVLAQATNMFYCYRWLLIHFKREFAFEEVRTSSSGSVCLPLQSRQPQSCANIFSADKDACTHGHPPGTAAVGGNVGGAHGALPRLVRVCGAGAAPAPPAAGRSRRRL